MNTDKSPTPRTAKAWIACLEWCQSHDESHDQHHAALATLAEHLESELTEARARIEDMLKGDDGQAWKEARKYTERNPVATPRTDACTGDCRCHAVGTEDSVDVCPRSEMLKLERELAEKAEDNSRLAGMALDAKRELAEARGQIDEMKIRHAAAMLHTQSIVDDANKSREQRDRLAELVTAVKVETYGGEYCCDVNGKNWFDAREKALAAVKGGQE